MSYTALSVSHIFFSFTLQLPLEVILLASFAVEKTEKHRILKTSLRSWSESGRTKIKFQAVCTEAHVLSTLSLATCP